MAGKNSLFLFLSLLAFVALAGAVAVGVRTTNEQRGQADCYGNMKAIAISLLEYHDKYKRFPPAYVLGADGRPAHSWRTLVLEFLDPALYRQYNFNEPWNGPNNRIVLGRRPQCFSCPNEGSGSPTTTSYVVVVGDGTAFPGARTTSLRDMMDGRSTTAVIVEIRDSTIGWTEPRDLQLEDMSLAINDEKSPSISSYDPLGPCVCFADASLLRVKNNVRRETVKSLLTIAGGEAVNLRELTD